MTIKSYVRQRKTTITTKLRLIDLLLLRRENIKKIFFSIFDLILSHLIVYKRRENIVYLNQLGFNCLDI